MLTRLTLVSALVLAGSVGTAASTAATLDAAPVGPLPKGPVTNVQTNRGSLVAVGLPRPTRSSGLVWRIARRVDARVVRQVSEAEVGSSLVVVFRVTGRGQATIRFGLTRGEWSRKAFRSATFRVSAR